MKVFLLKMLEMLCSAYTQDDYERVKQDEQIETNIGKLFYVLAWGLGSVQDQVNLVRLWSDIDYAEGVVLDRYGLNYGVKRAGANDTVYRLMIKIKLLSQLSGGDVDTVLSAASFLFGVPIETLDIIEFPMKISLDINEELFDDQTKELGLAISDLLKRIVTAGVNIIYQRTVESKIAISAIVETFNTAPPLCGIIYCGTYWEPSTLGHTVYQAVLTMLEDSGYLASPHLSGTLPQISTNGYSVDGDLELADQTQDGLFVASPPLTGVLYCGEQQ